MIEQYPLEFRSFLYSLSKSERSNIPFMFKIWKDGVKAGEVKYQKILDDQRERYKNQKGVRHEKATGLH